MLCIVFLPALMNTYKIKKTQEPIMTQGGKREGAGRKPRFGADKTIAMRVPEPLKPLVDQWLADYRALRSVLRSEAKDVRTLGKNLTELSLPFLPAGFRPAARSPPTTCARPTSTSMPIWCATRPPPSWSRSKATPCVTPPYTMAT